MNVNRAVELDVARGFAVIGMVLVHVYMCLSYVDNPIFYYFCFIPGTPFAAPVFMLLLGANLVFSHNNQPFHNVKRCIKMAKITFFYTLIGYAMPYVVRAILEQDKAYLRSALDAFMAADIFQFATLTMIFFAVCKKLKVSNRMMVLIAILLQLLRPIGLVDIYLSNDLSFRMWLYRLLIGAGSRSYFPFISWIALPIAGKIFAEKMPEAEYKALFYKRIFVFSGLICVTSILLNLYLCTNYGVPVSFASAQDYEQMHFLGNVIFISFVFTWISLCYFIVPWLSEKVKKALTFLSCNTTVIYCVHFPIIKYIQIVFWRDEARLGVFGTLICTIGLLGIGCMTASILKNVKNEYTI